ncbi:MAG: ferritin-like domain-containing protein [Verrucomicrobiota bacterium]
MKNTVTSSTVLNTTSSRRSFFGSALKTGAAVAALSTIGVPKLFADDTSDDVAVLNYALTLEHLEAAFYVQGLQQYGAKDFRSGKLTTNLGANQISKLYDYLKLIRDHEVTHVSTLISVIQSLGGTPVGPCTYNFGYSTPEGFLAVGQALENTGVMAYDGAIASIHSPDLQTAGATIATVEARHASYLNLVNGAVPFPAAFDTPKTMAEILAIAGQFIVSCP